MFCYAALGQREATLRDPVLIRNNDPFVRITPTEKKEGSVWPIVAIIGGGALLLWGLS